MDYGAPVGYRFAVKHPETIQALVVQNGNAYEEGLRDFWQPIKAYWKEKTTKNADALRNWIRGTLPWKKMVISLQALCETF